MLKRIIILFVTVMLTCCGCSKKDEAIADNFDNIIKKDYITVGVKTDSYPFGYIDEKGHYSGYDVSLARLIARGILGDDKKVKFVSVTSSDRLMKLYSEDVDMVIATMSVTPKRQEIIDFSNPYYIAGQALLVRGDSNIKGLNDLKGKKAAIIFGSTSENSLRTTIPNISIMGCKTYPQALKALKEKKVEAIVSDDVILLGLALKDNSVKLLEKRYSKEPYAIAFRKGAESKTLIKAVNNVINIETKNGHLKTLQENFGIK